MSKQNKVSPGKTNISNHSALKSQNEMEIKPLDCKSGNRRNRTVSAKNER